MVDPHCAHISKGRPTSSSHNLDGKHAPPLTVQRHRSQANRRCFYYDKNHKMSTFFDIIHIYGMKVDFLLPIKCSGKLTIYIFHYCTCKSSVMLSELPEKKLIYRGQILCPQRSPGSLCLLRPAKVGGHGNTAQMDTYRLDYYNDVCEQ